MDNFDSLIVSLLDSDAMKGCFKKELCRVLDIPIQHITDIWLETTVTDSIASQVLKVAFIDIEIKKEKLMDLPFKSIYENCIVFEVGDTVL